MTTYLLDSSVVIDHLRADPSVTRMWLDLLGDGHVLATSCVTVAEVLSGATRRERRGTVELLGRLRFLPTTREAAARAGTYRAESRRRGRAIHVSDALIAGTARAHGAVLVTHNVKDFRMRDLRVEAPPP